MNPLATLEAVISEVWLRVLKREVGLPFKVVRSSLSVENEAEVVFSALLPRSEQSEEAVALYGKLQIKGHLLDAGWEGELGQAIDREMTVLVDNLKAERERVAALAPKVTSSSVEAGP